MRFESATASRLLTGGFIAAGLISGVWVGLNQIKGVASGLDRIENLTLDWRFLLAGARPAPPGVVLVVIDDRTLSEAEGSSLSRETLARIVRAIAELHPRAVALDIAFPELQRREGRRGTRRRSEVDAKRRSLDRDLWRGRPCRQTVTVKDTCGVGRLCVRAEAIRGSLADRRNPGCHANGTRERVDRLERNPAIRSDDL